MRGYNTVTHKGEMGAYPSKHTHGCIRLRLTNWQTDRQSFSKSREWVFLHLFMFIGIRSIGRRLRHYLYKLVHYTQLDSNITYTVFIKNMVSKSQASSHRLFRFVSKRTPELAMFVRSHRSLHLLALQCSAVVRSLRYVRLLHSQDCSFTSLTPSWGSQNSRNRV